jgi:hypothetical protein
MTDFIRIFSEIITVGILLVFLDYCIWKLRQIMSLPPIMNTNTSKCSTDTNANTNEQAIQKHIVMESIDDIKNQRDNKDNNNDNDNNPYHRLPPIIRHLSPPIFKMLEALYKPSKRGATRTEQNHE